MMVYMLAFQLLATNPDTAEIRKLYYHSNDSKVSAKRFVGKMSSIDPAGKPILIAFKAMADLLQAKLAVNPYTKLSRFNSGKQQLESAVAKDPENLEIRFMRYAVQANSPSFLGYDKQLSADKAFILKNWRYAEDASLKSRIKMYFLNTNILTVNERSIFN